MIISDQLGEPMKKRTRLFMLVSLYFLFNEML